MKFVRKYKSIFTVAALSMLLLTGCNTTNPYTGQTEMSDSTKGAGIGAMGGALVGVLAGGGRGALIGGAVGALGGGLIGHNMDNQNAELRQRLMGTGVQVNQVGNEVQLVMASDISFHTNQASINSGFYPTLSSVAVVVKKYNNTNVTISGYTDNVGNSGYNQRLSEARAASVGDFLVSQGVSPNRIFTQGFGKRYPVASNDSSEGRSMNRRVVITLRPR
jgi:outer membrane protein OmpA-like peptidoglycan-associated protein